MIKVANISPQFVIVSLLFVYGSSFPPPLPPTMHNFYVVEGINLFYDFLEFV